MKLHDDTVAWLKDRLEQLEPDNFGDDWAEWSPVRRSLVRVIEEPVLSMLKARQDAIDELENMLTTDFAFCKDGKTYTAAAKRVIADLCRIGRRETYDPNACRTYRAKTLLVDGVCYEI